MKLADALLRRKELQEKVDQIRRIKAEDVYEMRFKRQKVSEDVDDIQAQVPKLELNQVTEEYDYYAKRLRLIDAAIQQLNWTTDIMVQPGVWVDFADWKRLDGQKKATLRSSVESKPKKKKKKKVVDSDD